MFNRKYVMMAIFLVGLLALSAVSAEDNATDIIAGDKITENTLNLENDSTVTSEGDVGTFKELNMLINNASEWQTLKLEKNYKNSENLPQLGITKPMTIDGQGHTIDANHVSRGFYINASGVTLKNITFLNGYDYEGHGGTIYFGENLTSNIVDCRFINCSSSEYGGAIYFDSGSTSTITDSSFINCSAQFGGAIHCDVGSNIEITGCGFQYNAAEVLGGCIFARSTEVSIRKSSFSKCEAKYESGGSITLLDSRLTADEITITDCVSEFGSAMTLLSSNSTISNSAFIHNNVIYDGGAIFAIYGNLELANSNFTDNNAVRGGGIYASLLNLSMSNNRFTGNSAQKGAAAYAMATDVLVDENNIGLDNDFYQCVNDNLTIFSDDYYLFKYPEDVIPYLPSYYSLIDDDLLTPVKDQGTEGNCWAFAAMATLESCIAKASGLKWDLSEANMKNLMAWYSDYGNKVEVNNGGTNPMIFGYLASWLGPIFEDEDDYSVNDFLSPLLKSQIHVQNILFLKRTSYTDNDEIKNAILRYGAVATGMHYDSTYLNQNKFSYYYMGNEPGNHEVCIVGWDDNYSKNNFLNPSPPGDGAWIVRNSWGPAWGDAGYFYVSYYDTGIACVDKTDSFTFILNDTVMFNRIYQYEIEESYYRIFYSTDEISYKNVFTVEGKENLTAVSTYFDNECNYTVKIYINGDNPLLTQSGRASLGYHTINLDEPLYLNSGDEVTVEFTCYDFTNRTAVMPVSFKNSTANLFLKKSRSFYRVRGEWIDLYSRGEVACIKMFTVSSQQGKSKPLLDFAIEYYHHNSSGIITLLIQNDATGIVKIIHAENEYLINLSETKSLKLLNITDKNNLLFVNYTGDEKYYSRSINYTIDTGFGTFNELKTQLDSLKDQDVLVLRKDYCFDSNDVDGIDITKSITIDGHGHTISGANISSIFNIWADNILLKNVKIIDSVSRVGAIYVRGSNFRVINSSFVNCYASDFGGALYWLGANGLADNCSFIDNFAYSNHGGAIYWSGDFGVVNNCSFIKNSANRLGGAICWLGFAGLINDSTFLNNSVFNNTAGAIYMECYQSNITNCRFEGNHVADESGGAVYLRSCNAIIENSSFKNNSAVYGGAVSVYMCDVTLKDCNFTDNYVTQNGGAVYLVSGNSIIENSSFKKNDAERGGAVYVYLCNATLKDCDFTDNFASLYGGAVLLYCNSAYLINSSFVENHAKEYGGAIMWWQGERGYFTDLKFEDNFAEHGGSIFFNTGNYNVVNSTFKSLSTYQIYCADSSGTIMGCKFYNVTKDNIKGNCNNFIKNYIDLKYNNTSFEYANPTILIYSDSLRDVPILSPATVRLSKNGISKSFSVNFADGIASIQDKLADLDIGEWNAQITVNADDNYNKLEDTFTITVNRASSSITLTAQNTTVGHPIELAAAVLDSANNAVKEGKVTFFDGSAVIGECSVVNGNASITYNPTDGGKHTIKAVFTADRYVGCEDEATVLVDIASVETVVENAVVGYQTTLSANVKALYSAITDGSVSFYVGDTFVGKDRVTNGAARFTYVPLNAATTTVRAVYSDSEKFVDAEDTAEFAINQADSNMTIGDWNGNVSTRMTLTAEVTSPNGQIINEGTVTFYDANDEIGKANVVNGAASISYIPSKAGKRMFKAVFKSDNYKSSEGSGTFVIEKSGSEIKISDIGNIYYNAEVTISAAVSSNGNPVNDGTVTFYIDGNRFNSIAVKNGYAGFSYAFADVGSHNISASFESENYYPSDDIIFFNVDKMQTSIASSNVNMVYNGGKYLALTLKDNNGMPLAGMSVTVNINGAKIVNTDANGQARVALDGLAPKIYSASIVFAGNDNYAGSSANVKVTVSKDASKLTASKKTYKAKVKTKKYTVTLKDSKGRVIKNAKLTLKVKGKTFKATTNSKGKATFKIKKLSKKGKHTATVKFAGNAFYGSTTKKVKITVK